MDCSTPGFPVLHNLPEFAQTHVHWVGDAIQPSPSLSSLFFLPSIFPSIRVFSSGSALCIRWPKYWSSNSSSSNEYSGLISFRIDWFDLPTVQGTVKSLCSTRCVVTTGYIRVEGIVEVNELMPAQMCLSHLPSCSHITLGLASPRYSLRNDQLIPLTVWLDSVDCAGWQVPV